MLYTFHSFLLQVIFIMYHSFLLLMELGLNCFV